MKTKEGSHKSFSIPQRKEKHIDRRETLQYNYNLQRCRFMFLYKCNIHTLELTFLLSHTHTFYFAILTFEFASCHIICITHIVSTYRLHLSLITRDARTLVSPAFFCSPGRNKNNIFHTAKKELSKWKKKNELGDETSDTCEEMDMSKVTLIDTRKLKCLK